MAFRVKQIEKILSDSGMPLENINKCAEDLCKRHAIDLDEIKEERDTLKTENEELKKTSGDLEKVQKELDDIKKADYKSKYEKLVNDNKARDEKELTDKLIRELCKGEGYTEKGTAKILKFSGAQGKIKLKDGKIDNLDEIKKLIADDWSEYKGEIKEKGADLPTPPEGNATPEKKPSRAAELAAQYHANLYGASEKAKGE